MAQWTIQAAYDTEAHVWYTLDSDIPGLVTSGHSLEELRERAGIILPELLELTEELSPGLIASERLQGPHSLRIVAFHESVALVAA
jgi:predicted RNase H-like HicB family nuclease